MATASRPGISVEEYRNSSYEVDCDLVAGELQERNLGELEHARMEKALLRWLERHESVLGGEVLPEVRIQISPDRFRVADIAVISADSRDRRIITTPPLIVIEILSPEDRISRYTERIADYRRMGITNIWIVDPMLLEGFDCSSGNWNRTDTFRVSGSEVELPIKQLGITR